MLYNADDDRNSILAAIIDSSEDAIISKNLDGIILSWNKSAELMFGYTEAEVVGKHIFIIIPEERRQEEDMIISSLKAGKRIEHFQTIRRRKNGNDIYISLTVSPVRDASGIVIGASKIARDITAQKQAEERLKRHALQLELINNVSRAIAAETDEQKILQLVTDTTTQLAGAAFGAFFYNKTDFKGESYMLYTLSGASRESFDKFGMPRNTAVFSKTFSGQGILRSDDITTDHRYGHNPPHKGMPQGHLPVVSYLAVPVISPAGITIGGLFFGHPKKAMFTEEHEVLLQAVSSLAAISLEKSRLYDEVKTLNIKKDEFIGFASHELKTPLTTIRGYLQLAEKVPDMAVTVFPKINKQVSRLSAIIADLLDVSKIQAGALTLHYTTVTLQSLITEAVEAMRGLHPSQTFQMELPAADLQVVVDAQKIEQVLANLLSNASKASASGSVITITATQLGDHIRISVKDTGRGIPSQELEHVFNRFYRVSQEFSKPDGLGMGLYISKEIMAAHHGQIFAESKPGQGSVFTIEFPMDIKIVAG